MIEKDFKKGLDYMKSIKRGEKLKLLHNYSVAGNNIWTSFSLGINIINMFCSSQFNRFLSSNLLFVVIQKFCNIKKKIKNIYY